jgi:hypothetical protein
MAYPKSFRLLDIKKLSNNRILSISNYGIRIYAPDFNKSNCYSLILMDIHTEGIEDIYEINDKNLLFGVKKYIGASLGGPSHDYIMIEKIELMDLIKDQKSNILLPKKKINNEKGESKEIISSLKFESDCQRLLIYSTYSGSHSLSNFVVLKNKYFIIMIDYHLLIFNLLTGKQMIRYSITKEGVKNLYKDQYMQIGKWNCTTDNEFYIKIKGVITLFELDDSKEINLKIIAYTSFPYEENLNELEDHKFYIYKDNNIIIY